MRSVHSTAGFDAIKRLAIVATVLCSLSLLLLVASSGAVAQVDVSLQPEETEVGAGEETTLSVVVEGADDGIGAYDLEVGTNSSAVTIENVTLTGNPSVPFAEVSEDGSAAKVTAAMGLESNGHPAAAEITIAELTVAGQTAGQSAEFFFGTEIRDIGPIETGPDGYDIGTMHNATVSVGTDDGNGNDTNGDDNVNNGGGDDTGADNESDDDGSGPGVGVAGALVALLCAGLLAKTR